MNNLNLTADEIEALAHRTAWRYKKSADPHHSDTYTFNRSSLLEFARKLVKGEREKPDLLAALKCLLNATMHKDHPTESDMAIAVIARAEANESGSCAVVKTTMRGSGLTYRSQNALINYGIEFIEDALILSDDELMKIPNFGRKALNELRAIKQP